MNRFRLAVVGAMLMLATAVVAQEAPQNNSSADQSPAQGSMNNGVPSVEHHLNFLSEKLSLSADQQTKAKPILQEMHDASARIAQSTKLSDEERTSKLRACHLRADTKLRKILNDDQKQKLDQLEQDAHMDLHANATSQAK
jgi:Spy/CpxP family protein refolding chaperone